LQRMDWFDDRYYKVTLDGKEIYLPSVTTIDSAVNKPFLNSWRGAIGNLNADIAVAIAVRMGGRVHEQVEFLLRGQEINAETSGLSQNEFWRVYIAQQMLERLTPRVIAIEATVAHLEELYAGTIDVLIEIDGGSYDINGSKPLKLGAGKYILDWKTGSTISDSNYRQQAAYFMALAHSGVTGLKGALIAHLGSKTRSGIEGLSVHHMDEAKIETCFEDFMAVKKVFERLNPNATPTVRTMPKILKLATTKEKK